MWWGQWLVWKITGIAWEIKWEVVLQHFHCLVVHRTVLYCTVKGIDHVLLQLIRSVVQISYSCNNITETVGAHLTDYSCTKGNNRTRNSPVAIDNLRMHRCMWSQLYADEMRMSSVHPISAHCIRGSQMCCLIQCCYRFILVWPWGLQCYFEVMIPGRLDYWFWNDNVFTPVLVVRLQLAGKVGG